MRQADRPPDPSAEEVGRGGLALLRDRRFGPYFFGSLASNTGTWFQNVAAILTIFALTRSAFMVGLVTALQFAMQLVLAPVIGAVADRVDRRLLIIVGQTLGGTAAAVLAVLAFLDTLNAPLLLTFVGLSGVGQAVTGPAAQALVPNIVGRADVPQAIALHSLTFNLSRAIGPVAGAATYALAGAGAAFAVNAASFLVFALALAGVRLPRAQPGTGTRRLGVFDGVAYVRHRPELVRCLIAVALIGLAMEPINTLSPLFAEGFGGGELLVGIFITCFGLGSALIAGWVGRLRRVMGSGRTGAVGVAALGVGMAVLAVSPGPVVATVGIAVGGAGYLLAVSDVNATMQHGLADGVRGRVMALWSMCFLGIRPAAAILHGWLGDAFSARTGAVVAVVAALAAAVVLRGRRALRAAGG
ncbi:MFS transporter [Micromonospora craniellae]|uniref:MFS transporter n=1 Tax=Micromonospora craniellae TaxID=2294034 RepID=A0A372G168_9ACTN|nr:MFS transporter [Micromonospora craniellae]QOC91859.1 MFS transporter [Micromonospora craniellae]RFS46688.1 MFS transporter [Micromonospora craniellae]